jgi:ABC-type bacteriocin/lantibiotic exporter with double-glycine peptidase domain
MTSSDPSGIYTMTTTLFLGGLRMLPSINRISAALNDIEFSSRFKLIDLNNSSIKRVYKEIEEVNFMHSNTYYSIKKGEILLITGESGSGKSSFLKHLIFNNDVNLIKYISGVKNKIKSESLMISYVDQSCNLYPGSLNDNINENVDGIDPKLFLNLLKKFGINVAETSDVSQLSGGQKQIFCVLRALYSNKTFVVLDEPTSSLDYESEVLLCEHIKKCSATKIVIIVTHRPHPLTLSDLRLII